MELLTPNPEGLFIQIGNGMATIKRIPTWLAIAQIVLTAWFVLAVVAILVYAPFWLLGGLSKKRRRPAERAIRWWPLIAVLSLLAIVVVFMLASNDVISRMGNRTPWSVAFFLATLMFGVASLASVVALWGPPQEGVRKGVRIFSVVVTLGLLIATVYLGYWRVIGWRPWT
jgi:hypothetical protein